MSFNRGFLNKRIQVLNRTASQDGAFGRTGGQFEPTQTIWANVAFSKGVKAMREGALDAYDTLMIRCDCHPSLKRESRLQYDGRTFQIESFNEDREQNEVQITCTEIQK